MSEPTPQSPPQPRRRPSKASWLLFLPVVLLVLIGLGLAFPDSPIYLPKVFALEPELEGRKRSEWVADLSADDPAVRVKAASTLGKMNTAAAPAMPQLIEVMQKDQDPQVRSTAADAVGKMYPTNGTDQEQAEYAALVLEPYTSLLSDPEKWVRMNAALALIKLKERAHPAVSALIACANDPENDTDLDAFHHTIQQSALRALAVAAAGTDEGVPTFTVILDLKIESPEVAAGPQRGAKMTDEQIAASQKYLKESMTRRIAVQGLGLAGEHGKAAAPKIRELLKSSNPDDRYEAEQALERMGLPKEAN